MATQAYWVWTDGEFSKEAHISVDSGALQHGYGVFETIYFNNDHLYLWDKHLRRLEKGVTFYCLKLPSQPELIKSATEELLRRNGLTEARIRISVFAQNTDYTLESIPTSISISALPYSRIKAAVQLVSMYASEVNCPLSQHKSLSYSSYQLARRKAIQQGATDALLLNRSSEIIEASTSNIFVYQDGIWKTPNLEYEGLKGIQREVIIDTYKKLHISFTEENIQMENIECGFICNSLTGIQAIKAVNNIAISLPPIQHEKIFKAWGENEKHF